MPQITKIPWPSRRRRFAANVAAIESRWPHIAAAIRQWELNPTAYELHQSSDGNYFIRDAAQSDPALGFLGGLRDHRADAALFTFDKAATPTPGPIIFDGIGHGWLLQKVLTSTQNSYLHYSCTVYILEPDPAALAMILHMHDLQSWLAHPRLHLFTGPTAVDDFTTALRTNPAWTSPQQTIANRLTSRPAIDLDTLCRQLNSERKQQTDALQARVNKIYANRDAAYWHKKFADALAAKRPLRVLGITTRFSTVLQYSLAELGRAVTAAGHHFKMSMEPDDHSMERPDLQLIADFQPDLLLQISRMRHEIPWLPRQIPYLCWDQDNLPCMRTPHATASLDALTYVAGHGAMHGFLELNWPRQNCVLCHPAAANHTYQPTTLSPDQRAAYSCDFSYVSNASQPPRSLSDAVIASWSGNKGLADVLAQISEEILVTSDAGQRWAIKEVRALVCTHTQRIGLDDKQPVVTELIMQALRVADRAYRHAGLRWVANWCRARGKSLRLYGRGWEHNPEFQEFSAGMAEPGPQLNAIYLATKINLQIIETGFLHSRALDGMAAGGFFLCREYSTEPTHQGVSYSEYHHAMRQLSQLALARGYDGIPDLQHGTEMDLVARWDPLKSWYESLGTRHADKAFHIWGRLPRAPDIFPDLARISFNDQATFAQLAEEYLGNPELRHKIATTMHRTTLQHFSYDARWTTFMETIAAGLESAQSSSQVGQLVTA